MRLLDLLLWLAAAAVFLGPVALAQWITSHAMPRTYREPPKPGEPPEETPLLGPAELAEIGRGTDVLMRQNERKNE